MRIPALMPHLRRPRDKRQGSTTVVWHLMETIDDKIPASPSICTYMCSRLPLFLCFGMQCLHKVMQDFYHQQEDGLVFATDQPTAFCICAALTPLLKMFFQFHVFTVPRDPNSLK